jgi:hypothetical protein
MSHHYSGPDYGFPHGDARLDLTDVYVFPAPGKSGTSVLIMNVHPSAGVNPAGATTAEPFATEAIYELKIDTNGDAVADVAYRIQFCALGDGQSATVRRVEGQDAAGAGDGGQIVFEGATVSTGLEAHVTELGDYRFFAGWRSEPFFFDTQGALNSLQFTGADFFADADICSIVLELPNSDLGQGPIGVWARTVDRRGGEWVQADRGARPSQSIFLTGSDKAAYLAEVPANDARFVPTFAHSLEHTGGYAPEEAVRVARSLLPDVLRYEPTRPASYPSNGRALSDDVMDVFISVITNGKITQDKVGPHNDLLVGFPYLGPPHEDRSRSRRADSATHLANPLALTTFGATLTEDIDWKSFPAFPPSARLAVVVGEPSEKGLYTVRVKVPNGVKLMPHRHHEDRVYTVISGIFYIGAGDRFDAETLQAYPPGSVVVLPGNTSHFHWAKSGEYVTQVSALGPLGIEYVNAGDDPRHHGD